MNERPSDRDRPHRAIRIHCPSCHATTRAVPILWGFPTPDGVEAARRGELVLGGCLVGEYDPSHVCDVCSARLVELPTGEFDVWQAPWTVPYAPQRDEPLVH